MHWNDARYEERAPCSQCSERTPVGPVTRTRSGIVCVACQLETAEPMPDSEWRLGKRAEFPTLVALFTDSVTLDE